MRQYLNEMTGQGDLVADPCLRYFPDGLAVLRIAVETCSEQRDQYTNEITLCKEQHNAVLYGILAEQVAWSMRQGDALWLSGPLHHRYFRDAMTGRNGAVCEIEVRQVNMLRVRQNDRMPLSAICKDWLFNNAVSQTCTRSA